MFDWIFGSEEKRNQQLIAATASGDAEKVRKLLKKKLDVNFVDPESGETALGIAADRLHDDIAADLIKAGANLNVVSKVGHTPLLLAANHGEKGLDLLDLLLKAGADPNLTAQSGDLQGVVPLWTACSKGSIRAFRRLKDAGANLLSRTGSGNSLMYAAAMGGVVDIITMLKEASVDVHGKQGNGSYPIHVAATSGHLEAIRYLLTHGAAVDTQDAEGATPLLRAALANKADIARLLVQNGANVEHVMGTSPSAISPLFVAATRGFVDVVRVLIEAGADPKATMGGELTILALTKQANQHSAAGILMNALKRRKAAERASDPSPTQVDAFERKPQKQSVDETVPQKEKEKASGAKMRSSVNELGVICPSLRYDEHEHGKQLSKVFAKARAEWVKSRNDPSNSHYAKACKLLAEWFSAEYRVRSGFSLSLGLNDDNEISRIDGVGEIKDASEAVEVAFKEPLVLKSFEIVWVDFRAISSQLPLQESEALHHSPEVGAIAVYQVKLNRPLSSPQALSDFLTGPGKLVSECFAVTIKNSLIETVEIDEDGDEHTSSSSSYAGGDVELVVNAHEGKGFRDLLVQRVRESHQQPSLIGEDTPEVKRLMLLGDEAGLRQKLDEGLPVDTKVDGETLLKLALMMAATASNWYGHLELSAPLQKAFPTVDDYRNALKRMVLDLLDRGADINASEGPVSVLTLAEILDDPVILQIFRDRTHSGADADASSLLTAAEKGNVASLRALVARGARVNKRDQLRGITSLMIACQGPGGEDAPPLTGAALSQQVEAVQYLIDQGARLDAKADNGDTAIGNAVRRGHVAIVKLLLNAGAPIEDALPRGQSLVALAKERGHQGLLALLNEPGMKQVAEKQEASTDHLAEHSVSVHTKPDASVLVSAALAGNHELAKELIANGVDVLATNAEGIPAFLTPVLSDDVDMLRTFLACGVSVNHATEVGGVTALMVAAAKGSKALVDTLIDAGADLDRRMRCGEPFFTHPRGIDFEMSALGCAVDAMHWELAGHMLDRGAMPVFGAMHTDIALTLAKFAPLSLIEKVHEAGFSIVMDHQFNLLFAPPVEMHLPEMRSKVVFWAAVNPDSAVLPWVLAHGGDPLTGNSLEMTSLIVAAAVGNAGLVEQLLEQGADVSAMDCDGDTALSLAVERGHKPTVKVLRRYLAGLKSTGVVPLTLHQAAVQGAVSEVLNQLDTGVSPNMADEDGNTPLMLAVKSGSIATIRTLFACGASVRPRNRNGQSAWDLAVELNDPRVRVTLREFGAMKPGKKDADDRFDPLELARGRYSHPFKQSDRNP